MQQTQKAPPPTTHLPPITTLGPGPLFRPKPLATHRGTARHMSCTLVSANSAGNAVGLAKPGRFGTRVFTARGGRAATKAVQAPWSVWRNPWDLWCTAVLKKLAKIPFSSFSSACFGHVGHRRPSGHFQCHRSESPRHH